MNRSVAVAKGSMLALAMLACDDKPHATLPSASASAAASPPLRLSSDLQSFSAWSVSGGASVALAPYRLRRAFALGWSDPKRHSIVVHFSQSAGDCREFLANREVSRTLAIDEPDHPEDPTSRHLANPRSGARARRARSLVVPRISRQ